MLRITKVMGMKEIARIPSLKLSTKITLLPLPMTINLVLLEIGFRQINVEPISQFHQVVQDIGEFLPQIVVILRLGFALKTRLLTNGFGQLTNLLREKAKTPASLSFYPSHSLGTFYPDAPAIQSS